MKKIKMERRALRSTIVRKPNPIEEAIIHCISGEDKEGFKIRKINDTIASGVFATKEFKKSEFLLEYHGEHISVEEGERREKRSKGNFLFFFGKKHCIDATYSQNKGRMVNDEIRKKANCVMKAISVDGETRLCLFAQRNIVIGEELRYDYGVKDLPWRTTSSNDSALEDVALNAKRVIETRESTLGLDPDQTSDESFGIKEQQLSNKEINAAVKRVTKFKADTSNVVEVPTNIYDDPNYLLSRQQSDLVALRREIVEMASIEDEIREIALELDSDQIHNDITGNGGENLPNKEKTVSKRVTEADRRNVIEVRESTLGLDRDQTYDENLRNKEQHLPTKGKNVANRVSKADKRYAIDASTTRNLHGDPNCFSSRQQAGLRGEIEETNSVEDEIRESDLELDLDQINNDITGTGEGNVPNKEKNVSKRVTTADTGNEIEVSTMMNIHDEHNCLSKQPSDLVSPRGEIVEISSVEAAKTRESDLELDLDQINNDITGTGEGNVPNKEKNFSKRVTTADTRNEIEVSTMMNIHDEHNCLSKQPSDLVSPRGEIVEISSVEAAETRESDLELDLDQINNDITDTGEGNVPNKEKNVSKRVTTADTRNEIEVSTMMNIHDDPNCLSKQPSDLVSPRGEIVEISSVEAAETRETDLELDLDQINNDITDTGEGNVPNKEKNVSKRVTTADTRNEIEVSTMMNIHDEHNCLSKQPSDLVSPRGEIVEISSVEAAETRESDLELDLDQINNDITGTGEGNVPNKEKNVSKRVTTADTRNEIEVSTMINIHDDPNCLSKQPSDLVSPRGEIVEISSVEAAKTRESDLELDLDQINNAITGTGEGNVPNKEKNVSKRVTTADTRNEIEVSTMMNIHDDPNCLSKQPSDLVSPRGEIVEISSVGAAKTRETDLQLDLDQINNDITDTGEGNVPNKEKNFSKRVTTADTRNEIEVSTMMNIHDEHNCLSKQPSDLVSPRGEIVEISSVEAAETRESDLELDLDQINNAITGTGEGNVPNKEKNVSKRVTTADTRNEIEVSTMINIHDDPNCLSKQPSDLVSPRGEIVEISSVEAAKTRESDLELDLDQINNAITDTGEGNVPNKEKNVSKRVTTLADTRNEIEVSTMMNIHDDPNCLSKQPSDLVSPRGEIVEISSVEAAETRESDLELDLDQINNAITGTGEGNVPNKEKNVSKRVRGSEQQILGRKNNKKTYPRRVASLKHLNMSEICSDCSDSGDSDFHDPTYKYSGDDSEDSDDDSQKNTEITHHQESMCPLQSDATSSSTFVNAPKSTYVRPKRPCPFCGVFQTKLSRHIKLKHKDLEEVADALNAPKQDRWAAFLGFKKQGIFQENKKQSGETEPVYQQERKPRKPNSKIVMCGKCKGFYHSKYLCRHKKVCLELCEPSVNVPLSLLSSFDGDMADGFLKEVLYKLRDDDIGEICKKDPFIVIIGKRLWMKNKLKLDKQGEIRKSVMTQMRRLGALYQYFLSQQQELGQLPQEEGTSADMFCRKNFNYLEQAIREYTLRGEGTSIEELKHGLKTGLYYLIKKSCKILKGTYLIDDDDERAEAVDKFVEVFELNHDSLFGDASYAMNKIRNEKLRKPEALPLEEDISKVRNYTVSKMEEIMGDPYVLWDSHIYVEMRDLLVCRLTLFNARRGGEPSRLRLVEWQNAANNVWITDEEVDKLDNPLDKLLAKNLRITYQTGKGNKHLVPVLMPQDTLEPLKKMADEGVRTMAGVAKNNPYLFASTQNSDFHVSGWHAVRAVCDTLNLNRGDLLTATKNRHRVSTIYASMEVPESERRYFYSHMGHSREMNQDCYQAPLALMEVIKVGRSLNMIDGTSASGSVTCEADTTSTSANRSHSKRLYGKYAELEDEGPTPSSKRSKPDTSDIDENSSNDETPTEPNLKSKKRRSCSNKKIPESFADASDIDENSSNDETPTEPNLNSKKRRSCSNKKIPESFAGAQTNKRFKKPARKYSQWTREESDLVISEFKDYVQGRADRKLPSRQQLQEFQRKHNLHHDWLTIKTKVFNERNKSKRLAQIRSAKMQMC